MQSFKDIKTNQMRKAIRFLQPVQLLLAIIILATIFSCTSATSNGQKEPAVDSVAANIKMYTHVWDEIINKRMLDKFNDSNFTKDVVMHASPADVIGIDSARAYYANYLTGFSDITFTIKDVFGTGNKLVKHWNFKGTHTGLFFGIPATHKKVDIDGVTLVRMAGGKIAEERDFLDNLEFMQQLGLIPR
jgi:steroid delta-isomerase-like uncharacterized protein